MKTKSLQMWIALLAGAALVYFYMRARTNYGGPPTTIYGDVHNPTYAASGDDVHAIENTIATAPIVLSAIEPAFGGV